MEIQRTRLDITEASFTDNKMSVSAGSTLFAQASIYDMIPLEQFKGRFNQLSKACLLAKCRLYRKGYKDLLEQFSDYEAAVKRSHDLFRQYSEAWKAIVERGIYSPTVDDEDITGTALIRSELESMYYRSAIISRMEHMHYSLCRYLESDLSKYKSIRL